MLERSRLPGTPPAVVRRFHLPGFALENLVTGGGWWDEER